jgi:hypothetical protein
MEKSIRRDPLPPNGSGLMARTTQVLARRSRHRAPICETRPWMLDLGVVGGGDWTRAAATRATRPSIPGQRQEPAWPRDSRRNRAGHEITVAGRSEMELSNLFTWGPNTASTVIGEQWRSSRHVQRQEHLSWELALALDVMFRRPGAPPTDVEIAPPNFPVNAIEHSIQPRALPTPSPLDT